jgi:hypothetical protein
MSHGNSLTTADIRAIFTDEIVAQGGNVTDIFDDGARLMARSILPRVREVRRDDRVQGGVALRADGPEIWVHPYVFRQVCSNGAIMAWATESRCIEVPESSSRDEIDEALHEVVRACCADEVFAEAAERMRTAREARADVALNLMPLLSKLPPRLGAELLSSIMGRFEEGRDRSRFGLMNAVTSVARDARDPDVRWRLEEFGGGLAVAPPRQGPRLDQAARAVLVSA